MDAKKSTKRYILRDEYNTICGGDDNDDGDGMYADTCWSRMNVCVWESIF